MGFFDGATQDGSSNCGVGSVFIFQKYLKCQVKMNCGKVLNTQDELLALWVLVWVAQLLQISYL